MSKHNRVSIVIPVYNEAAHLRACLDAIAGQTVNPFEVIVVDNNSTDDTESIARQYAFVTFLSEARQGVVYARDTGFDYAAGAIIGRIDADSIIETDWVQSLQQIFDDETIDLVTGRAKYHAIGLTSVLNGIDLVIRRHLARVLGRDVALQGANMALRRSVWRQTRQTVCRKGGLHEDFDIGIHATQLGYRAVFDERLVASLAFRQIASGFNLYLAYVCLSPKTFAIHGLRSRKHFYPVIALALLGYFPIKLLYKGYDPTKRAFSWSAFWLVIPPARVNPATFVD